MAQTSSECAFDVFKPIGCLVYHYTFGIGTIVRERGGYYTVHFAKYDCGGEISFSFADIHSLSENLIKEYNAHE